MSDSNHRTSFNAIYDEDTQWPEGFELVKNECDYKEDEYDIA